MSSPPLAPATPWRDARRRATRARALRTVERLRDWLGRRDPRIWMPLLAALILAPSLGSGLAADDHHFRMVLEGFPGMPEITRPGLDIFNFAEGSPEANRAAMARGLLPWWAAPDVRLAFWRPLTAATHALDDALWRDSPVLMHVHSLAWYALLALTVAFLYRSFLTPAWVAVLACFIYTIDDTHVLPAGWIASRNSVIACIFAALAVLAHHRWRGGGRSAGAVLGPVALAVGLLSGEAALGACGYLLAYALFLDEGSWRGRLASLAPYAVVAVVWRVIYRSLGYGVIGSGMYLDPGEVPGLFLAAATQRLPVLLFAQFAGPYPGLWLSLPRAWAAVFFAAAVAFTALVAWAVWPLLRRDRAARFWAFGMILALVPACAGFPQFRALFLPGLGAAALVAQYVRAYVSKPSWLVGRSSRRVPAALVFWLWIVAHVALAPVGSLPGGLAIAVFHHTMMRVADGVPRHPAVAEEDVVIVGLPSDIMLHATPYIRSSLRWPTPRSLTALYSGTGSVDVARTDEATLVVEAADSFVSWPWAQMFANPAIRPFAAGDTVRLPGLTIEILDSDGGGRPTRVAFRFARRLEAAADHWLTFSRGVLVPFPLPGVGHSVTLPRVSVTRLATDNLKHFIASRAWTRLHRLETGPLEARR